MASKEAIGAGLGMAQSLYPSFVIGDHTAPAWHLLFADVDDETFTTAIHRAFREDGRKFAPTPGDVQAQITASRPQIDTTTLLRHIEGLGSYNPHTGWTWPRVETVRAKFGDGVAAAYGMVGPSRFASANETTREIALRDFAEEVQTIPATERVLLAPLAEPKRLAP